MMLMVVDVNTSHFIAVNTTYVYSFNKDGSFLETNSPVLLYV